MGGLNDYGEIVALQDLRDTARHRYQEYYPICLIPYYCPHPRRVRGTPSPGGFRGDRVGEQDRAFLC